MKPKKPKNQDQADLFRSRLDQILDRTHPLFVLANQIDWSVFENKFGTLYADKGRPALPTRLMVGLHYLKHAFDESDESVVARLLENPYWQYFCGYDFFIHHLPLDPSSLVRWRKRIGPKQMEQLLGETLETAKRGEYLTESHMERVNVDTTVQEKAIAFPTDARLQHKARVLLVKAAKDRNIPLRQSYLRLGKRALIMSGRYAHARQMRRARAEQKKVKNYLGRVYRNILRECPLPDKDLAELLQLSQRLLTQKRNDKNKLYSLHEPHIYCMSKGKAHQRYEFGTKAAITTTRDSSVIIGALAFEKNVFDGHTVPAVLAQVKCLTNRVPGTGIADRGYRGKSRVNNTQIVTPKPARKNASKEAMALARKRFRRRAGIEPIIGHLKSDHRLKRNFLKGFAGDQINLLMAAAAFNFRKWMREVVFLLRRLYPSKPALQILFAEQGMQCI